MYQLDNTYQVFKKHSPCLPSYQKESCDRIVKISRWSLLYILGNVPTTDSTEAHGLGVHPFLVYSGYVVFWASCSVIYLQRFANAALSVNAALVSASWWMVFFMRMCCQVILYLHGFLHICVIWFVCEAAASSPNENVLGNGFSPVGHRNTGIINANQSHQFLWMKIN